MKETSKSYEGTFLIYFDRLGASSRINSDDPIYGNRKGFYEMFQLYHEPFELAKNLFGDDFVYYGFSDTILILILKEDIEAIAKLASQIYLSLLAFGIHSKLFVTYGNFAYHNFKELKSNQNVFISPVYGETLLKAYELDKTKIEYLGVFIEDEIANKFNIKQKIKITEDCYINILNLEIYLDISDFEKMLGLFENLKEDENVEETKKKLMKNPAISGMLELMRQYKIPEEEIENNLTIDTINRNLDRKAVREKIVNTYNLFKNKN